MSEPVTVGQKALVGGGIGLFSAVNIFVGYKIAEKKLKTKYEILAEQEIAEARAFYEQKLRDIKPDPSTLALGTLPPGGVRDKDVLQAVETLENYGNEDPDVREKISGEGVTVVTNIFNDRGAEIDVIQDVWDIETEMRNRTEDAPFIISDEEFLVGERDYEQAHVTFYEEDGVLADARDQMIPDADEKVGDHNLAKKGHGSKDPNMLYVRNDVIEVDFEISFSNGSFAQQVLGFEHSDTPRRRRGGRPHWDDE